MVAHQSYSGPLPPASELKRYNEACPNAAERIISLAEKEQQHRHDIENRLVQGRNRLAFASVLCATVCIALLSGVICYALYLKATMAALGTAIAAIASVVGIFTYNSRKQK